MTELELFDWLRTKQANKKLTQTMVDGVNELLALMSIEDLKESLQKINGWDDTIKDILGDILHRLTRYHHQAVITGIDTANTGADHASR